MKKCHPLITMVECTCTYSPQKNRTGCFLRFSLYSNCIYTTAVTHFINLTIHSLAPIPVPPPAHPKIMLDSLSPFHSRHKVYFFRRLNRFYRRITLTFFTISSFKNFYISVQVEEFQYKNKLLTSSQSQPEVAVGSHSELILTIFHV